MNKPIYEWPIDKCINQAWRAAEFDWAQGVNPLKPSCLQPDPEGVWGEWDSAYAGEWILLGGELE